VARVVDEGDQRRDVLRRRLTALGRDEIGDELKRLADEIADYLDILRSRARIMACDTVTTMSSRWIRSSSSTLESQSRISVLRGVASGAALDLPGAAPRRQGPLRHVDPRRGFRHPAVRRQHLVLDARIPVEDLGPARGGVLGPDFRQLVLDDAHDDLRLQRLTALGRDEIGDELKRLADEIADYLDILRSRAGHDHVLALDQVLVLDARIPVEDLGPARGGVLGPEPSAATRSATS
jgi:hypothetical protein